MAPDPILELVRRALVDDYRHSAVARLREVLTDDQVVAPFVEAARLKQIEGLHDAGGTYQDPWSLIDTRAIGQLIRANVKYIFEPGLSRSDRERIAAELDAHLRRIAPSRDAASHPTESNRQTLAEAKAAVESAIAVLEMIGAEPSAVRSCLRELASIESARGRTRRRAAERPLPRLPKLRGRERDLEQLAEMVQNGATNLFTVVGPAGVGKTTFARVVSRTFADGRNQPMVFVPLDRTLSWRQALTEMAQAFDLDGRGAVIDRLGRALRARPSVLVLDNLEHLLEGAADIERLAGADQDSLFILTSRQRLDVSLEQVFQLRPLATPSGDDSEGDVKASPAVQLFLDRLASGRGDAKVSTAELEAAADIARRVGGVPLLLTIAAAHAIDRGVKTVCEGLGEYLETPTTRPNQPDHHRTLSACLDWSWDLLDERQRAVFRRACLLFGSYSRDTLLEVCRDLGLSDVEIDAAAAHLVRHSLIERTPEGFTVLESMPQYIALKLEYDENVPVLFALVGRALRLAEAAEPIDEATAEQLAEIFSVGANALARLTPGEHLPADTALLFLLWWARLSWRYEGMFARWDDDLIAAFTAWAVPKRTTPTALVAASLAELARLLAAYDKKEAALPAAELAVALSVRAGDTNLAKLAAGVFVDICPGASPEPRRLFNHLRRRPFTEACATAINALVFPGYPGSDDEHEAFDWSLAIDGLLWLSERYLQAGKLDEARATLFETLPFGVPAQASTRQNRRRIRVAEKLGDPRLVSFAHWQFGINWLSYVDAPWYEEFVQHPDLFVSYNRQELRKSLPEMESAVMSGLMGMEHVGLTGAVALYLDQPMRAAKILLAGISGEQEEDPTPAVTLTELLIERYPGEDGEQLAHDVLLHVADWLRRHSNPMAAYAIAWRLGAIRPGQYGRLARNEKEAARNLTRDLSTAGLLDLARREVKRAMDRILASAKPLPA